MFFGFLDLRAPEKGWQDANVEQSGTENCLKTPKMIGPNLVHVLPSCSPDYSVQETTQFAGFVPPGLPYQSSLATTVEQIEQTQTRHLI